MKRIRLEDATEGMTLARAVENISGMVLYPAGIILDPQIIEKLKSRNIDEIWIEAEAEPRFSREEYIEKVDKALQKVRKVPLMMEIKEVLIEHIKSLYG
jgi:pyruvate formate-lyase activating enzyme-like uncharacterized protein